MTKKKFNEEQEKKIVDLYLEGSQGAVKIGKLFNCDSSVIYSVLYRRGINFSSIKDKKGNLPHGKLRRNSKINFSEEEVKEMIRLYNEEFLAKNKIAKKFGISNCVVNRILKENKIKSHSQKDYRKLKYWSHNKISFTEEQKKQIVKLYEEDLLKCSQIGKLFNCSENPIRALLNEKGIDMSPITRKRKLIDSGKYNFSKGKNHYAYGKEPYNKLKFSEEQIKEIVRLYCQEYKSFVQIGEILGVDSGVISRILKEKGIDTSISTRHKQLYKIGKLVPHNKGKSFLVGKKNPMYGRTGELNPQFKKIDMEKAIKLYQKGLSSKEIGEIFEVSGEMILERLRNLKIPRRKCLYGSKDLITTDDGHKVRSSAEVFIDNFLFHNHIEHIYEKKIGFGNFKCDFYIPSANLYIEYWGLNERRIEHYFKKTQQKLEIYKKLGLNLLSIYPKDNVSKKLSPLLEFSKNQSKLNEFLVLE